MCASVPSMIGEPSLEGLQSSPANLSGSLEPNRAETSFWFSCSTFTQNLPLASIACHDRDTLVGQNNTSGGSRDSAANDWQANPMGWAPVALSDIEVMMVMPVQNWPSTWRNVRGSIGSGIPSYLKPMVKSWPHRLTAVLSLAIQSSSVTSSPSQPNSMSKPPGVFM